MNATPRPIAAILDNPVVGVLMRVLVTFPFWASGLALAAIQARAARLRA